MGLCMHRGKKVFIFNFDKGHRFFVKSHHFLSDQIRTRRPTYKTNFLTYINCQKKKQNFLFFKVFHRNFTRLLTLFHVIQYVIVCTSTTDRLDYKIQVKKKIGCAALGVWQQQPQCCQNLYVFAFEFLSPFFHNLFSDFPY